MIITTLNSPELSLYGQLNKYFPIAFDLAKKVCQNIPENGKYSVDALIYKSMNAPLDMDDDDSL